MLDLLLNCYILLQGKLNKKSKKRIPSSNLKQFEIWLNDSFSSIQENSLRHAFIIWQLYLALTTLSPEQQEISSRLLALWIEGHKAAEELIKRIFLPEVLSLLKPSIEPTKGSNLNDQRDLIEQNWIVFIHNLRKNHRISGFFFFVAINCFELLLLVMKFWYNCCILSFWSP